MTIDEEIAALKRLLVDARELLDISQRFLDLDLSAVSRACAPPRRLLATLLAAAHAVFGDDAVLAFPAWLRVKRHRLLHAPVMVSGRLGTVLYAEDLRLGLLTICEGTGLVHLVRFGEVDACAPPPRGGAALN